MFDFTKYMDSWPKALARLIFLYVAGQLLAALMGAELLSIGSLAGGLVLPVSVATIAYRQKRSKRSNLKGEIEMLDFSYLMDSWPKALARFTLLIVATQLLAALMGADLLTIGSLTGSLVLPVIVAAIAYRQKQSQRLG